MRAKSWAFVALCLGTVAIAADTESKSEATQRKLHEVEAIGGIPCKDTAWFREDGTLDSCFLAQEQAFGTQVLPAGTRVALDREGRLDWAFLPETMDVGGHRCRGGGHDFMTGFYPGGALRLCWLAADEDIQGVPCAGTTVPREVWRSLFGEESGVSFHPGGELQACRLSREFELAGQRYEKGSRLELDPDGHAR